MRTILHTFSIIANAAYVVMFFCCMGTWHQRQHVAAVGFILLIIGWLIPQGRKRA